MKISFYTTLLFASVLIVIPGMVQSQNNNYRVYRSVDNKAEPSEQTNVSGNLRIATQQKAIIKQDANSLDKATVSEVDSLLKNNIGVRRIQQGSKSVLKLELDPASKTSLTLLGCIELGSRYPQDGKATPDPKVAGIPTVRKRMNDTKVLPRILTDGAPASSQPTTTAPGAVASAGASKTTPATTGPTVTPRPSSQPFSASGNYSPSSQPYSASSAGAMLSPQINEAKTFRNMKGLNLVNNTDQAFYKKYSIVLGSFTNQNNADFVKRTFNALGERVILVRNNSGVYIALLASFDSQAEAVKKFNAFSKKYTEGMSRARRVSKYGIPLDDMWILVKE